MAEETTVPPRLYQQWQKKLDDTSRRHENGHCVIWTGYVNAHGYGQFRFKDPRDPWPANHKSKHAHRMAMVCKLRDLDIPTRQQASHLCNRKLCINTAHLVLEPNVVNLRRRLCFLTGRCNGHVNRDGERAPDCLMEIAEPEPAAK